jgi:hypothetical protein
VVHTGQSGEKKKPEDEDSRPGAVLHAPDGPVVTTASEHLNAPDGPVVTPDGPVNTSDVLDSAT